MKTILETDRVLVREYVDDDAEAFFKLGSTCSSGSMSRFPF
jgi:hypothetical protein